jgi:hypothetical protein
MRTKINPDNRDDVLWLQMALADVLPGASWLEIGKIGPLTEKMLRLYQHSRGLLITGTADETTLAKIQQELGDGL